MSVNFIDLTNDSPSVNPLKRQHSFSSDDDIQSIHSTNTDNDDVIITHESLETPEPVDLTQDFPPQETICYGQVESLLINVDHNNIFRLLENSLESPVVLYPIPNDLGFFTFQAQDMDMNVMGELDPKMSSLLSPLMGMITVEAIIPKVKFTQTYSAVIHLLFFGPELLGSFVAKHFLMGAVYFRAPSRPLNMRFSNPQTFIPRNPQYNQYPQNNQNNQYPTISSGNQIQAEKNARTQIQAVYDYLTAAEDLPEMEADQRLITCLYKHQRQALHFMVEKEKVVDFTDPKTSLWILKKDSTFSNIITNEIRDTRPRQCCGGILAGIPHFLFIHSIDDMGLGKTLEVISLLLKNQPTEYTIPTFEEPSVAKSSDIFGFVPEVKVPRPRPTKAFPSKGTLIICPLSTISNWEEQINAHVKEDSLSVYIYHGPGRIQDAEALADYDVVITTYNLLASEFGKASRENKARMMSGLTVTSTLQKIHWFRVVLDEAHSIKESGTTQSKAACALKADKRWCLTGTPIQNKLDDLYSLIKFIGIEPFNVKGTWSQYISKPIRFNNSEPSLGVSRLQTLFKSITLRRTKDQQIDGQPILNIPPKFSHIYSIELNETERALYDKISQRAKNVISGMEKTGGVMQHYIHVLEMILRLRQISNHFSLCNDYDSKFKEIENEVSLNNDYSVPLTASRASYLHSLLKEAGDESCFNCGTFIEANPIISKCGHQFCNDCSAGLFKYTKNAQCPQCSTSLSSSDLLEVSDTNSAAEDINIPAGPLKSDEFISSTKIDRLVQDLIKVRNEGESPPVKSVIFSQWTKMLNLLEKPLIREGFSICRLDGQMKRIDRSNAIERFKKDPKVTVMLISLKAGGVGLNLTNASRVYLMEPYWNPAVEQQAVDRVHRLGQTRPVHTIRLIAKSTIEENIVELQKKKMKLAKLTFNEDEEQGKGGKKKQKESMQKQRLEDLRNLFK